MSTMKRDSQLSPDMVLFCATAGAVALLGLGTMVAAAATVSSIKEIVNADSEDEARHRLAMDAIRARAEEAREDIRRREAKHDIELERFREHCASVGKQAVENAEKTISALKGKLAAEDAEIAP